MRFFTHFAACRARPPGDAAGLRLRTEGTAVPARRAAARRQAANGRRRTSRCPIPPRRNRATREIEPWASPTATACCAPSRCRSTTSRGASARPATSTRAPRSRRPTREFARALRGRDVARLLLGQGELQPRRAGAARAAGRGLRHRLRRRAGARARRGRRSAQDAVLRRRQDAKPRSSSR